MVLSGSEVGRLKISQTLYLSMRRYSASVSKIRTVLTSFVYFEHRFPASIKYSTELRLILTLEYTASFSQDIGSRTMSSLVREKCGSFDTYIAQSSREQLKSYLETNLLTDCPLGQAISIMPDFGDERHITVFVNLPNKVFLVTPDSRYVATETNQSSRVTVFGTQRPGASEGSEVLDDAVAFFSGPENSTKYKSNVDGTIIVQSDRSNVTITAYPERGSDFVSIHTPARSLNDQDGSQPSYLGFWGDPVDAGQYFTENTDGTGALYHLRTWKIKPPPAAEEE